MRRTAKKCQHDELSRQLCRNGTPNSRSSPLPSRESSLGRRNTTHATDFRAAPAVGMPDRHLIRPRCAMFPQMAAHTNENHNLVTCLHARMERLDWPCAMKMGETHFAWNHLAFVVHRQVRVVLLDRGSLWPGDAKENRSSPPRTAWISATHAFDTPTRRGQILKTFRGNQRPSQTEMHCKSDP